MALVWLGVLGLVLKWLEIGPVAHWSWWAVLSPFGLAMVWWAVSDALGFTARARQKREDSRRELRRRNTVEALGRKTPLPRRR
ncbi:TIGR04438 family Trp-rich protein [Sphaerotilus sp.]|uniref:TIGR04438 family Trp-rich protein n=1 Tax=Sphaerotilus sp. TaxID=2093942 RepID=UPI00286DEDDF|nr:TIGR04438 family Trp-rich protein [Sphaerotilus sp.]